MMKKILFIISFLISLSFSLSFEANLSSGIKKTDINENFKISLKINFDNEIINIKSFK
jgi:hypothetical protein